MPLYMPTLEKFLQKQSELPPSNMPTRYTIYNDNQLIINKYAIDYENGPQELYAYKDYRVVQKEGTSITTVASDMLIQLAKNPNYQSEHRHYEKYKKHYGTYKNDYHTYYLKNRDKRLAYQKARYQKKKEQNGK